MAEKFGIENLKKVLALGVEMGNVGDKMGRTKGLSRYLHLMDLFDELTAMANFKVKEVRKEYNDLSDSEMNDIKQFIRGKFDIKDDMLEELIEDALGFALVAADIAERSVKMYRKARK